MATVHDVQQGILHERYEELYGKVYDEAKHDLRYQELIETHIKLFDNENPTLFSTAGRSELGGNHTDHNKGKVLAATINLDTIAAVSKTDDLTVVLISEGYPAVTVDVTDLTIKESEYNTTESLVRGIASAFVDRGLKIGGFVANTSSNVLKGSGLSSSAAIEVLCGTIFNHLYNNDALNAIALAQIGQFAENRYFGKPSGLMDQLACGYGGIIGIDFEEEEPKIEEVAYSFEKKGYRLVIVDTGGNHADLTHEYASVPIEMRSVASFFGKENLRSVDEEEVLTRLVELRSALNNDRAILRTLHFYEENKRVDLMLKALKADDVERYIALVNESGESSFCFLQNLYPSIDPSEQGLSLAIGLSKQILQGNGAVRVHGGGFAGTIQAYVPTERFDHYKEQMEKVFGEGSVTALAIRNIPTTALA